MAWGVDFLHRHGGLEIGGNHSAHKGTRQTTQTKPSDKKGTSTTAGQPSSATSPQAEFSFCEDRQAESDRLNPNSRDDQTGAQSADPPPNREKLLNRIRKLFAMAQATEASPYEAEIALRRCQKLMARYGIQESDLHTSQFSSEIFRAGSRIPMHIKWLATAVEQLHTVLFVTGGPHGPEFRGFDVDVKVASMTMEYLEGATERSLTARRHAGTFPPGRSAAYDYRVSFAMEIHRRVTSLVAERKAAEAVASGSGTALTIRKKKIVETECTQDLITTKARYNGARPGEAAEAGRTDGAKVSLDPQVGTKQHEAIE